MTNQLDNISKFLSLSKEISLLEELVPNKMQEYEKKYFGEYGLLKGELRGYITKIKPTVEAVCNLYNHTVSFSDNKIYLKNGMSVKNYTPLNAREVAIASGNESVNYLAEVIKKVNVEVNLREFALRYNTVVQIYEKTDELKKRAVKCSLEEFQRQIDSLKAERNALFKNEEELDELIYQINDKHEELSWRVMLEDEMEVENEFVKEISLPIGYESQRVTLEAVEVDGEVMLSLLEWKLHEDGIMVIRSREEDIDSTELSYTVVNTVIKFLSSYPSTHKQVLLCDSCSSNIVTTFAGILKNGNANLFFEGSRGAFVKNSAEEISSSLTSLGKLISHRIMLLGQSRCSDILEYNHKNQDNPHPIILVVLNGYPLKYENCAEDIQGLMKNGREAGVYFLVTENTNNDEDMKYYRKRLPSLDTLTSNTAEYEFTDSKGILHFKGERYFSNTCGENYNLNALLDSLRAETAVDTGAILLDSVVDKENFQTSPRRRDYSKVLSIPFGKQGANPVFAQLGANGPDAHLALIGTTGSGKTAFINSLILSACKLYSPEELEIHLILMVKNDFKIFEEQGLPHLKTLVTGDRIFAANDILDFIDEEMKRRANLIGSYGNIYSYNKASAKPLPRCMIVIDEFYQLVQDSDEAIDRINRIAQVGRAYGISLVISSIRFPMEVNSLIPLFGNRIEFKSGENAGQLIPQAASRQSELEGVRGSCFYSHSGNLQAVRVAYSGDGEKLTVHIQEVRRKFSSYQMQLQSRIEPVNISCEADVPFAVKNAKRDYDEEGILRARLGRKYLSDKALEYKFDSKNNILFLFGHYLETKMLEASLIKDTFVLSEDIDEPTVYYIDCNKNASLKRKRTAIKSLRDDWVMSGKMVYCASDEAENAINDIRDLIQMRQEDEECEIYPVLTVIARADELLADDDLRDELLEIIVKGKENNVYFVLQCNEYVRFYGRDKYLNNAIVFPDRYSEGDGDYSSTELCAFLEELPAGACENGRKLISNASVTPLDPRLHILCENNKTSIFVPYEYDEEYLKNIVD